MHTIILNRPPPHQILADDTAASDRDSLKGNIAQNVITWK